MARKPTFAQLLGNRRRAAGITRYKLAQQTGIDNSYVTYLERGDRRPGRNIAERLADALNCPELVIAAGYVPGDVMTRINAGDPGLLALSDVCRQIRQGGGLI